MTEMLKIQQTRYQAAFDFLSNDLPAIRQADSPVWQAFLANSHLVEAEAVEVLTMNGSAPLVFASDLGASVFGQFDRQIPDRIEIGIDILSRFAENTTNVDAKQFLRVKVLHEICHWACFRGRIPDNDSAGEAFEQEAFGRELMPWWRVDDAPALPSAVGDVFADPSARAALLMSSLGAPGFAPGRREDPNHRVFGGADVAEAMPRGYRNNNPGNIRVGSAWRGLADPVDKFAFQTRESNFCVFREPEWGLRALAILLRRYKNDHGLDTPRKIISRWAPANDNNDVASYAAQLASALGINPDGFVDANADDQLLVMMRAIARHENGAAPPYADMQYKTALLLV